MVGAFWPGLLMLKSPRDEIASCYSLRSRTHAKGSISVAASVVLFSSVQFFVVARAILGGAISAGRKNLVALAQVLDV